MGLDFVELVMAVEEAFGADIPNADAARLTTPREMIDYLLTRLPTAEVGGCLSQRAFYKVRRAAGAELGVDRAALRPDTALATLFPPDEEGERRWEAMRVELGAAQWPRIRRPGLLGRVLGSDTEKVGDLADFMVSRNPRAVKDDESWTRAQVTDVVRRVIERELGVDMSRYTLDSRFVKDMGVD